MNVEKYCNYNSVLSKIRKDSRYNVDYRPYFIGEKIGIFFYVVKVYRCRSPPLVNLDFKKIWIDWRNILWLLCQKEEKVRIILMF